MRSSLLTVSALVAGIAAQSYTFPPGFDMSLVDGETKDGWCQAQRNTCPMICPDGYARENNCNPGDLSFACVCGDGTSPDVAEYISTIPFFVCKENEAQCIKNSQGSLKAERACKEAAKECGSKNANKDTDDDDEEESTTSSARATRTSSPTSATTAATTTTDSASASPTDEDEDEDNSAAGQTYSMGLMAAAMVGVFGFLA